MKTKLCYLILLLIPFIGVSQMQIGADINGDNANERTGSSISLSSDGRVMAVGARENSENGVFRGQVRMYYLDAANNWIQLGNDINGEASQDRFGYSVSVSSNGNTVAIGAIGNDDNGVNSGHVRVYRFNDGSGTWNQVGADINGESSGDQSGASVSLSSDGNTVAIGAFGNDDNAVDSGQVSIYQLNSSNNWVQVGADINGEAAIDDRSGWSVSLSSNGNTVAIGAFGNDGNGSNSGHVRVYQLNSSNNWVQVGADIDGASIGDNSGYSISLSSDGTIVAIGAPSSDSNGTQSGQVSVYQLNSSNNWVQLGADIESESFGDNIGWSVSLSGDGSILAAGALGNDGNGADAGHARIYQLNVTNNWTQIGVDIDGQSSGDLSGYSVSLSSDGNTVAIGAYNSDVNAQNTGQVRVFDLTALTVCNVNIPDANFKAALVGDTNINTNGNTEIECSEASAFTGLINVQSQSITDMTGIEAFTAATALRCNNNQLTSLDVSNNVALTELACGANQINTLDVSANTALISFSAFLNNLTTIDISSNTNLEFLSVSFNDITSANFSNNSSLKEVYVEENDLTVLDVTNLNNLEILQCHNNQISVLDVTNAAQLERLQCYNNQLSVLDVTNNPQLNQVLCGFNQLTELDFSQNPAMITMFCQTNQLTSLNMANGNNSNQQDAGFRANNNPNLTCIEVDNVAYSDANWTIIDNQTSFSTDCSVDTTPPVAVCQNITVQLDATGNASIIPSQIDNGSTDNVGISSIALNQTTFDCSNLGVLAVQLTVTDLAGNFDTCIAQVTVQDSIAPTGAFSDITMNTDTGECGAIVGFNLSNVFVDNCMSTPTLTVNPAPGSFFPVGDSTVNITATDNSGNVLTTSFLVTVIDNEAPVITNPGTITMPTIATTCDAVVNYALSVTDNCSSTVTYSIPSGSTFPIGTTPVVATATDPSGNTTTTSFDVVVNDTFGATLNCLPSVNTVMVASGAMYSLPDYIAQGDVTGMDNCPFTLEQSPVAGTMLPVGTHVITFILDGVGANSGNGSTCTVQLIVDEVLGVDQAQLEDTVSIHPNPTATNVTITSQFEIEQVVLYSMTGQKVMTSTSEMLNVQDLASGMYFVNIQTKEGSIVKRFMKK